MAKGPLTPPPHLGPGRKWIYHSKLTNDARELYLYTFTSTPSLFAVVKRVDAREALVHTQCAADNYPHIIQILDRIPLTTLAVAHYPTADVYLVMEHATGGTLEDLLTSIRPLPPPFPFHPNVNAVAHNRLPAWFCYHMFAEILDAVLRIHTREGIMHTDLHLKNVMFQKQPQQLLPPHPPASAPPALFINPDEIPLEEEEDEQTQQQQLEQQQEAPWAAPVIKIIDFGRVHQLPPEEDDEASQWENKPSPCLGLLVRMMLLDKNLYEDELYAFLEPLARSLVSVQVLCEARTVAMARKGENMHVPQWLRDHFQ